MHNTGKKVLILLMIIVMTVSCCSASASSMSLTFKGKNQSAATDVDVNAPEDTQPVTRDSGSDSAPSEIYLPSTSHDSSIDGTVVIVYEASMRSGGSQGYPVIADLSVGTRLSFTGDVQWDARGVRWFSCTNGTESGYVSSHASVIEGTDWEKNPEGARFIRTTGTSNIRSTPDMNGAVVAIASLGTNLTYLGESYTDARGVAWSLVRTTDGITGYISEVYSYPIE